MARRLAALGLALTCLGGLGACGRADRDASQTHSSVLTVYASLPLSSGPRVLESRAVANGELRDGTDVTELATLFGTIIVGLSIKARDGVPLPALQASVTQVMDSWDALATATIEATGLTQA